jgi:hypothetical protein
MTKKRVYWFWHWELDDGTIHASMNQSEAERALREKPLRTIWAERIVE